MRLLIATSNPGKLRDFSFAASSFPQVTLEPLPQLDRIAPPEETAATFSGNALIKAEAYGALASGEIVVADDSGLELPALNGAPGVRSARYADDRDFPGAGSTDARNNGCLLAATQQLTGEARMATYRCVLAAVRGGSLLASASGQLTGRLLEAPRGGDGFGYDPLFLIPELNLTMAEVDGPTRLRLSHRGRALRALLAELLQREQTS